MPDVASMSKQQRRRLRRCEYGDDCPRYAVLNRLCRLHAGYASQRDLEAAKVAAKQPDPPQPVVASLEPVRRVVTVYDWRRGWLEAKVTFDGTF